MNDMISTTVLLFLIIDPIGNLPIFMSILQDQEPKRQQLIIIREMLIALLIMLLFIFSGKQILSFLNLRTETVSISGGMILFLIAMKMIFPFPFAKENDTNPPSLLVEKEEPFLVPLAIPLVAGPSILATLLLLSHQYQYSHQIHFLILSLLIAWSFSLLILILSNVFFRILSRKGLRALERIMGLLLIMISTQMCLDGIRSYLYP